MIPVLFLAAAWLGYNWALVNTWWLIRWNFHPDGAPRRCTCCGSGRFREEVRDSVAGHVSEIAVFCLRCREPAGYWAYGAWEPAWQDFRDSYRRSEFMVGAASGLFSVVWYLR